MPPTRKTTSSRQFPRPRPRPSARTLGSSLVSPDVGAVQHLSPTSSRTSPPLEERVSQLEELLASKVREINHLREESSGAAQTTQSSDSTVSKDLTTASQPHSSLQAQLQPPGSSQDRDLSLAAAASFSSSGTEALTPFLLLGSTLPQNLKSKIQSGQFVDLPLLAPSTSSPSPVALDFSGTVPTLSVAPPTLVQPQTASEWLRLFTMYSSVFLQSQPHMHLGPDMMTYITIIMDMEASEPPFVWRAYDTKFRMLRALCPSVLPWGRCNFEILAKVKQELPSLVPSSNFQNRNSQNHIWSTSDGSPTCRAFFARGFCDRKVCRYKHLCSTCGHQGHSFLECPRANRKSTGAHGHEPSSTYSNSSDL